MAEPSETPALPMTPATGLLYPLQAAGGSAVAWISAEPAPGAFVANPKPHSTFDARGGLSNKFLTLS